MEIIERSNIDKSSFNPIFDLKRVITRILNNWYFILGALLVFIFGAYIINRYSERIYSVSMSMIIKESEANTQSAEILYSNPLTNQYRNFYNELYILKSLPLLKKVVEDNMFHIQVFKEGNVLTLEKYRLLPYNVKLISDPDILKNPIQFNLEPLEGEKVKLTRNDQLDDGQDEIFNLYDTIDCKGFRFYLEPISSIPNHINEKYIVKISDPTRIAIRYQSKISVVWAAEGASVIDLTLLGSIAEKEKDFLINLVAAYDQRDLSRKIEAATRTINFIDKQLKFISDTLLLFENQLEIFKDTNVLTNLSDEAKRILLRIENLESQKVNFQIKNTYFDYLEDYIKNGENLNQIILPTAIGFSDPVLTGIINNLVQSQLRLRTMSADLESQNPLLTRSLLIIEELKNSVLESMISIRKAQNLNQQRVENQIKEYEKLLKGLPSAERKLITIQRNYRFAEGLFNFLLQKKTEAGISRAATISDIEIVNPPLITGSPIYPNTKLNYVAAIIVGLIIPISFFFLVEVFNKKIQSKEDLDKLTSVPFLGMVGHSKYDSNLVVEERPRSNIAESFRALRSNLNYFKKTENATVILVTSSIPNEGKTFTSINLGNVFALSGKRTLLVGADMRKPRLHKNFNLENELGLSSYLISDSSLSEIIMQTNVDNLSIISSGPIPPNPGELLINSRIEIFFNEVKEKFDIIIIDSSPIALVNDAFSISKYSDHIAFIVRQGSTHAQSIALLEEIYKQDKMPNLSIVLNDVKSMRPGYGYGYGYNYGYREYEYSYGYGYSSEKSTYYS